MTDIDPLAGLDCNTEWTYCGSKNGKAKLLAVFPSIPKGGLEFVVTRDEVHNLITQFGCNEAFAAAYNELPTPVIYYAKDTDNRIRSQ
jgi:hypothetical protein